MWGELTGVPIQGKAQEGPGVPAQPPTSTVACLGGRGGGRAGPGPQALDCEEHLTALLTHMGSTRPGTAQVAKAKVGLIALTEKDLHMSRSACPQKLPTEDPPSQVHRPQGLGQPPGLR